ncbi:hypothetical protein LguiB_021477 [Lonicera macranthoides]
MEVRRWEMGDGKPKAIGSWVEFRDQVEMGNKFCGDDNFAEDKNKSEKRSLFQPKSRISFLSIKRDTLFWANDSKGDVSLKGIYNNCRSRGANFRWLLCTWNYFTPPRRSMLVSRIVRGRLAINDFLRRYGPPNETLINDIDNVTALMSIIHPEETVVLTMHRLIQDMGREIIQEESCEVGERSRLWHHHDAFDVLESDTGTEVIEGLTLDMRMLNEAGDHGKKHNYDEFRDKSILSMYASSLKRCFLNFNYGQSVSTTIISQNDVYLRTDAFRSMRKLRLLVLNYVQITGSFDNFPKGLVWLSWHGFPLKSIPIEFPIKKLVALDLSHSRIEQLWMETPFVGSLKILDLSYSEWLARTPNFLRLRNLERLILKGCVRLVEVCESIGSLKMLDLLDLQDCKTLRNLPRNIGKLGSLKSIIISGCNIGELPSEIRNMTSLEVLKADGIFINPLGLSSREVKWWERIIWQMVWQHQGKVQRLYGLPYHVL